VGRNHRNTTSAWGVFGEAGTSSQTGSPQLIFSAKYAHRGIAHEAAPFGAVFVYGNFHQTVKMKIRVKFICTFYVQIIPFLWYFLYTKGTGSFYFI